MNKRSPHRLIFRLIFTIMIMLKTSLSFATLPPDTSVGWMDKITSIATQNTGDITSLIIQGNGKIPDLTTRTIPSPPRIIVDILHTVTPFKSILKQVSSPELKTLRVGYHPESIRMVLDVNGPDVPHFSTECLENRLVITLYSENSHKIKALSVTPAKPKNEDVFGSVSGKKEVVDTRVSETAIQKKADATPLGKEVVERSITANPGLFNTAEQLTRVPGLEGQDGITTFTSGIEAYQSQKWPEAVNRFTRFLETFPANPYAEQARFLMAKAHDRLNSDTGMTQFNVLKQHYEDAIYQYPDSPYVPDAYLSIGDLCFRAKLYSEALGYCNFVIDMDKQDHATPGAMILKGKILSLKNKKDKALAIFQSIQQQYPNSSEAVKSKIETAKVFFDLNQFQKSLDLLSGLAAKHEYIYQYPDISRYFGDNLYQLGQFRKARQHLFRYYNMCPDNGDSHLILARVADAYREDNDSDSAIKVYHLVLDRYPDTEGALISVYRLADLQEEGDESEKTGVAPNFKIIGSHIDMPRKIYEDVIQNAIDKDETSPLTQYALLKLSRIDLKEKKYTSSLNRLKALIEKYPRTKLRKEIEHTYEETLLAILQKDYKIKRYKHIINTFLAEKANIIKLKSPRILITIARSALALELEDMAVEMFKKATPYLSNEEKPADLLFSLAKDFHANGKMDSASLYLDLLIKNHPKDKYIPDAYLIKGDILSASKNSTRASAMYSMALEHGSKNCDQPAILLQRAKTLMETGSSKGAFQAISAADDIIRDCPHTDIQVFEDLGNAFIQFGYPKEALSVFTFAHDLALDGSSRSRLKMLMARCHELLNNKPSYLAIYNEVANQNDPFWGNVAKEKIEEMKFSSMVEEVKK
jgi:TolA-binding protein